MAVNEIVVISYVRVIVTVRVHDFFSTSQQPQGILLIVKAIIVLMIINLVFKFGIADLQYYRLHGLQVCL